MFAVIFEVKPKLERWDDYLAYARLLRPELERTDGFIENIRYASRRRNGWVLSLSLWRDEKALVRWRTHPIHHGVQEKGRFEVFDDYHLRVGEVTADTGLPPTQSLREQRLDETEVGAAKTVSIIEMTRPAGLAEDAAPETLAGRLGLADGADGLIGWDLFPAITAPDCLVLLLSWRDTAAALVGEAERIPAAARYRRMRVVRDYGMFDRHEAPQCYPEVGMERPLNP